MTTLGTIYLGIKNLLFPAFCRGCERRILSEDNLYFCAECWSSIQPISIPYCPQCGKPQPRRVGFEEVVELHCAECKAAEPQFSRTFAAGLYDGVLKDAIHLFKFGRKRLLLKPLGNLLVREVGSRINPDDYDIFTYVPLHPRRKKERGFDQAERLAGHLAGAGLWSSSPCLERTLHTQYQSRLAEDERWKNVKRAFSLRSGMEVTDCRVLLVDDVVTTGATVNECCRVLRKAGAAEVDVLALAVTPQQPDAR